jgi:ABC-type multidrug transport system ATPase subunit
MVAYGGSVLQAIDLKRSFAKVKAVDGASLDIRAGEVVCLIGPNGAGKTTLLLQLGGVLYPSSGHVKVFGLDRWRDNFEIRKRTTFLPAELIVGEAPTPYEYLRFLGQIYGLPRDLFVERVRRLSDQMQLGTYLHKAWDSLSLGLGKKTALVGCFLPDAQLRFLDEPFAGGVDPIGMEVLYDWFGQARERGETIVFSTQVLEQAESVSDRIAMLTNGHISHIGTPAALIAQAGVDPAAPRALNRAFMKFVGADSPKSAPPERSP